MILIHGFHVENDVVTTGVETQPGLHQLWSNRWPQRAPSFLPYSSLRYVRSVKTPTSLRRSCRSFSSGNHGSWYLCGHFSNEHLPHQCAGSTWTSANSEALGDAALQRPPCLNMSNQMYGRRKLGRTMLYPKKRVGTLVSDRPIESYEGCPKSWGYRHHPNF